MSSLSSRFTGRGRAYHGNHLDDGESSHRPTPSCHANEGLGGKWSDESGDYLQWVNGCRKAVSGRRSLTNGVNIKAKLNARLRRPEVSAM